MVPEEFRDTTGRYDGAWRAQMLETEGQQTIQGWKVNCSPMKLAIPLVVENGEVTTRINDSEFKGFISNSGRFRVEIPTQMKMSASISSEADLRDGSITLILQGDLNHAPPAGRFTLGVADLGNDGCSTPVRYYNTQVPAS